MRLLDAAAERARFLLVPPPARVIVGVAGIGTRDVRLTAAPRYMKEKHVRLQLAQGPRGGNLAALGWSWAERVQSMHLGEGSVVHLAYRLRENEHPEYGGLELEIAGIYPAG